jgi:WD40 repeat protein
VQILPAAGFMLQYRTVDFVYMEPSMPDDVNSRRKLALVMIAIAGALLLSGCTQSPVIPSPSSTSVAPTTSTPQPSPISAPSQTATATSTVKPPTAQPWSTPAVTPSSAVISPDNAGKLKQLAQFGMGTVHSVALSANGRVLAIASSIGIHLYDPDTLKLIRLIPTERPVGQVALSRDGRRLMSLEWWNQGLRIWDTATGKVLQSFDIWTGPQHCVAFSPDGQTVALAEQYHDKPIQLLDVGSGQLKGTVPGDRNGVYELAFSPDGQRLASSGSYDPSVRLWELDSKELLRTLPHHRWVTALTFTHDGEGIVTVEGLPLADSANGVLRLWDVTKGTVHHTIVSGTVAFDELQFSPDGSLLAGIDRKHILHVWDASTDALLYTLPDQALVAGFSSDGSGLLSIGVDNRLQLWDTMTGHLRKALATDYSQDVYQVAFSPNGQMLAFADDDGYVRLHSPQTGEVLHKLKAQRGNLLFAPHGNILLSLDVVNYKDTIIRYWDTNTGRATRSLNLPGILFSDSAVSPDGSLLALSTTMSPTVQLRDSSSGAILHVFTATVTAMTNVTFSPDGHYLAAGSIEPYEDMKQTDNSIWLWDIASGKFLRGFGAEGGYPAVMDLAFSPDGKLLATASDDQKVQIWNPNSGKLLYTLEGGGHTVAFSPDGRLLASGDLSFDGINAHVWDTRTGKQLQILKGHTEGSIDVAFSPDGRMLATGARDGTIRLWGIPAP